MTIWQLHMLNARSALTPVMAEIRAHAREMVAMAEAHLQRALLTQTWKLSLSDWADVMALPMAGPLQSVTHIKYYDTDGVQQTLSSSYYTVHTGAEPGAVALAPGYSWPTVQPYRHLPIEITYVCGWTAATSVPEVIRQGIRLLVGAFDADRTGGESAGARQAAAMLWDTYGRLSVPDPTWAQWCE